MKKIRLVKNELGENPSYQDGDEGRKGYPECPLSPPRGFSLLYSYWGNAINKPSPILAGIWADKFIAGFLRRFTRLVKTLKLPFVTNDHSFFHFTF